MLSWMAVFYFAELCSCSQYFTIRHNNFNIYMETIAYCCLSADMNVISSESGETSV